MNFHVNKSSEFPIYQQLKEQIRYFLLSGNLQPGSRMPTPKDLGTYLMINKNTVIAAYKELEKEGLLVTKHGQGTYIPDKLPALPDEERRQALIGLVRETIEKTKKLGFQAEDLFTLVFNQTIIEPVTTDPNPVRALFVECNAPDLQYFQEVLKRELGIEIHTCLLSDLHEKLDEETVVRADFVITSVVHLEDVKSILEPLHKEVVAINAAPHFQTFMRVAQLPQGTRVAVVCGTGQGALRMKKALEDAGIRNVRIDSCGIDEDTRLREILHQVDWIITSRIAHSDHKLKTMAPPGVRFMELFNELDQAGMEMLKQYLKKRR